MIVSEQREVTILSIHTLGSLAIELAAAPAVGAPSNHPSHQRLQFETRTVEALLIYLVCHGRPLGRDLLAELLWPERTQAQARANLRTALHRLRQQLDPYLLVTRQHVALNPAARISLDVARFEAELAAGQLTAATALYRGDFLDGFYLGGSPAFEQWALLERERLRTLAIAAYQQLSVQRAAAGQLETAIAAAQRLLQLDPLHEPTYRQLMRLLAQTGQRSAALAQYETCRQLLTAELAVMPDEMTTALFEQIRAGKLDREQGDAHQHAFVSPLPISLARASLPAQPTPFIGRSAELAQIEQLLANPDCRLLTLLGLGGIGKTRLAIEAATRQNENFANDVCFVALTPVGTAELVLMTLAQSLGLQAVSSDLQAEIATYLRPRKLLLVMDNFEHLLAAADTVAHLLHSAPHVKVLITSRERLSLREEWLMPISGLALTRGTVTGGAGEAEQLFLRSAQRVHPGFTGQGQEEAMATICRQVEGMPLALELAASWVRVMACTDIARQMRENFDFLSVGLRNLPERHRSLRALFDQSWRLLSPLEQGVLMRLSIFRGGWRHEEAEVVTGATLALLLGLVDKSLVRTSGQNRFDLHELVRQYAMEQLVASGEADSIYQRHYAAYLHLVRTADPHLRGAEDAIWFARLAFEQGNLRAALQWTLDEARYADTAWLVVATNWFWERQGLQHEAGRCLAQLLPHRHTLAINLRLAIFIIVNASAAHIPEAFQPLSRYTDEILALLEGCSEQLLQSVSWYFIALNSADFSQISTLLERAIAFVRTAHESPRLGPEFGLLSDRDFVLGIELCGYAGHLFEQGEFVRAASLAKESLTLFQARGNRCERAGGLGLLGHLALLQGDLIQAQTYLYEALTIAAAVNYQEMMCAWQPLLGRVALYNGDTPAARQLLTESLERCSDQKLKPHLARNCTCLAETALWEGELDQAEQWLAQSLAYHAELRSVTIFELERLWVAARLATAQQQHRRAATLFGLADQMHNYIHYGIVGPMRALADAALETVREALDAASFAGAFATGQQLPFEAVYATMLKVEPCSPT